MFISLLFITPVYQHANNNCDEIALCAGLDHTYYLCLLVYLSSS